MSLRPQIRKILKEELETKRELSLIDFFQKKFNDVLFVNDFDQNSRLFSKNQDELFIRNWWGMLWVQNCDFYNDLRIRAQVLGFSLQEFHSMLVKFVNNKYKDYFKDRPLRYVGDENNCSELEWGENQ